MKAQFWMPLVALLCLAATAEAQQSPYGYGYGPSPYSSGPRVSPGEEAVAVLREGMDKLLGFLGQEERPNKLQVAAFLDKEIAPYFDFARMARWAAGPRYAALTPEQREAMTASIEASFLTTLASRLASYQDQQVRFFRPRASRAGRVSVTVGLLRPGNYPAKLEFRMYRGEDGWKIYDVLANGRSAVAHYRMQLSRTAAPGAPMPYGR